MPGVQLTWMDAKVGDRVVTPRIGKPVEVQALWVNALAIAGRWPGGDRWVAAACGRATASWRCSPTGHRRADRRAGCGRRAGRRDRSVRPNQVLAAGGLPIPVLTPRLVAGVVAVAERDLLTPLGLRTLAPDDPAYRGRYAGGPAERDGAYHQGTVWPWLLGPFVAAWLAARGNTAEARAGGARALPAAAARASAHRRAGPRVGGGGRRRAAHARRLPVPGLVAGRADPDRSHAGSTDGP